MSKDLIRYDLQVQHALKGVVRKVLIDAARDGLPGDHHFYISFKTQAPGVRLSQRLRDKYPEEMTIVLQHQFWDLGVTEHTFEVGLSFSGIPERLLIPFDAISGFFDPSVQFGLKFEIADQAANGDVQTAPAAKPEKGPVGVPAVPARRSGIPAIAPQKKNDDKAAAKAEPDIKPKAPKKAKDKAAEVAAEDNGAVVVSLDSFRKK